MGRGARLAYYNRRSAEDAALRVTRAAMQAPEDQAEGIMYHLADRRGSLLSVLDDEDAPSFKRTEAIARIKVLAEVATLAGVGAEKAKGKAKRPKIEPPKPGTPEDSFRLYLRNVVTPAGWRDTLGKKLNDTAEGCLEKMLKAEAVEHNTFLRQECLYLFQHLVSIEAQGEVAESRMRRAANG